MIVINIELCKLSEEKSERGLHSYKELSFWILLNLSFKQHVPDPLYICLFLCGSLRVPEGIRGTRVRRERRVTAGRPVLQDCLGGQDLW